MNYQVIISEVAEDDMVSIGQYISNELHAPDAAANLLDEMDKQILSLEQIPNRFSIVSDEGLARRGIRSIPVKNYLVFYVVDEATKTVIIARVLYSKRNWIYLL